MSPTRSTTQTTPELPSSPWDDIVTPPTRAHSLFPFITPGIWEMSPEEIARNRAILARRHQEKLDKQFQEIMNQPFVPFRSVARRRMDPCLIPLPRSPFHSPTEPEVIKWSEFIKSMIRPPPVHHKWVGRDSKVPVEPVEPVEEEKKVDIVAQEKEVEQRVRAWADVVRGFGKKDTGACNVEKKGM
jgi:hypothetical protein